MRSPFVIERAIEAKSGPEVSALESAMHNLEARNPSSESKREAEAGTFILRATDEARLDAALSDLKAAVGSLGAVGSPQVAYREALVAPVEIDFTHKKQSGGAGEFARIKIRLEPGVSGQGFVFVDAITNGNVPREYTPAIEAGLRQGAAVGHEIGFPIADLTATLIDGAYHNVDSSAWAFQAAGRGALREGARKAGIKILEPIMKLVILTGQHALPALRTDLIRRRARIDGQETGETCIIVALAPMATLFGLDADLQALSRGDASVAMLFDHYGEVPPHISGPDDTFPAAAALRA